MLDWFKKNRLKVIIFLLVVVVAVAGFAWWRVSTSQKLFEKHYDKAVQLEKSGETTEALKELELALKYLPRNNDEKRAETEKKISELKSSLAKKDEGTKPEGESEATDETEGGNMNTQTDGGSQTGGDSQDSNSGGEDVKINITELSVLLPASFLNLEGSVSKGEENASVRFDDVDAETNYIIYIHRFDSSKKAEDFVKNATSGAFSLNVEKVSLRGEYSGRTGYYAENSQGDSLVVYSYGPLGFECLLRTETLGKEEKKEKIMQLQEVIKKP